MAPDFAISLFDADDRSQIVDRKSVLIAIAEDAGHAAHSRDRPVILLKHMLISVHGLIGIAQGLGERSCEVVSA